MKKSIVKYLVPLLLFGIIATGAYLNDSDRPLALVQKFKPDVNVHHAELTRNIEERGKPLFNGDTLRTNEEGMALVQFMDKSFATVKQESQLIIQGEVESRQNTSTRIGLELGEIFLNVSDQGTNNFEVATDASVASVKGTQFGATSGDYFWVEEGIVDILVTGTGEVATLNDSTYAQVREDGTIETGRLTEEEIQDKKDEYAGMTEQRDPEVIRLRFVDENGVEHVIEIKVFED
jgi:hypothetical protein